MEIKGKAKITVGLCRTVAITELSEVWAADGSSSGIIKNEIIEYGSTDFAEDVLGIYLDDPKELNVEFTAKCSFCSDQEVDEIEYTAIELEEVSKASRGKPASRIVCDRCRQKLIDRYKSDLVDSQAEVERLRECLRDAIPVLLGTYDVNEWPATGDTNCDLMAERMTKLLEGEQ